MVDLLCRHYGKPIENHGEEDASLFSFPGPSIIASSDESALRQLKLGYRAPYLLQTARMVDQGIIDLAGLPSLPVEEARSRLVSLPGVGRKIADCVLLFSCGFLCAFPVDVWIQRILCQIYFSNRRITASRLAAFTDAYFGPFGGLAQQFLFHWIRTGSPDPERYRVPYRDRRPSRIPPVSHPSIS
jgi:N-glycosylase/DNA lyase